MTATVVLALGELGGEVSRRLARRLRTADAGRPMDLTLLDIPLVSSGDAAAAARLDDVEARLISGVERQLALSAVVARPALDSSPPWLDVLVVGDLGEAAVRAALDPVLDLVDAVLSTRFGHLLGREGSRSVVVPVLALGGAREPGGAEALLPVVERLAARARPKVRAFLVESQTARYVLVRDEVVSSVVAFIELLVRASLRDTERLAAFLRDEAPETGASREPATIGTFGIAGVRVPDEVLGDYCRARAALAVVESMRSGSDPALAERESMARKLRAPWDEIKDRLGLAARSEVAFEQVEAIVRQEEPDIPCPPVQPGDSPEAVKDLKFGRDWLETVRRCIDELVSRLEGRRMPELADQVDRTGLEVFRQRRREVLATVDGWVWSGPRGWARALSALRLLGDEARAAEEAARRRVEGSRLPVRPGVERLLPAVQALRSEADRRPRPFRMWLTGATLWAAAALLGHLPLALLAFPLAALGAPEWLVAASRPPASLAIAGALAGLVVVLRLRAVVRARHGELCEVRDELRRAIEALVVGREGSILAHYLARLELGRALWVLRLARAERRALDADIARLEQVQRALDALREQLRASQRRLGVRYPRQGPTEDLSHVAAGGDLILREALSGDLLAVAYAEAVEDEGALAAGFFEELGAEAPSWRGEAPQADLERIESFVSRALTIPRGADMLARGAGEDGAAATARQAVERAFEELAMRLSPALEVGELGGRGRTSWVLAAPEVAWPVVDDAVASVRRRHGEAFAADWIRLSSPRDDGQLYLLVLVTHLPASAVGTVAS